MPTEREVWRAFLRGDPEARAAFKRLLDSNRIASTETMNHNEPMTLLAGSFHNGITGCVQVDCSCGRKVWLTPSTQEMLKQRGDSPYTIQCNKCFKLEEHK
jgi:hypothetical protein